MSFWSKTKEVLHGRRPLVSLIMPGPRPVRIAVIGGKSSGKTVFLTALANHLQAHNPNQLPLDGWRVRWDRNAIAGDTLNGLKLFDYNGAKTCLTRGEWPNKTTEAAVLALRVLMQNQDGQRDDVQLEILDIPGERVADFPMMGHSYEKWCSWLENTLAGPNGSSIAYREYLEKVRAAGPDDEKTLLSAYRDFMAHQYAHFQAISPSVVKLGLDGTKRGGSRKNFRSEIETIPVGITLKDGTVAEFIPLPKECFAPQSPFGALVKKFSSDYAKYTKMVVRPMERWLKDAQKLFYLVDVLSLLQAGPEAWDTEKEYADAAISSLCPKNPNIVKRFWKAYKNLYWRTQLNSVYVIATKSDLVFSTENRDNMVALADELVGDTLAFLDKNIETEILSCSSVCSTREVLLNNERCLKGVLSIGQGENRKLEERAWIPSDVPTKKPASSQEWNAMREQGRFNYQFAFPGFDASQSCPPPHLGLNTLVKKMLVE